MDAVTYPDTAVRAELSSWMEFRSDVAQEKQLAAFFEVAAIPTAVLLHPDGRVLDRVVGFVEPEAFEKRLAAARSQL